MVGLFWSSNANVRIVDSPARHRVRSSRLGPRFLQLVQARERFRRALIVAAALTLLRQPLKVRLGIGLESLAHCDLTQLLKRRFVIVLRPERLLVERRSLMERTV